ncbi:MAG: ABC transporter ATP-binding protein [Gemmatimonadota bacterium]|jgi:lipoprotein-releasing system ATP-binding protein
MADGAPTLLQARALTKTYGERVVTRVLKGIDLELRAGEFCALTGPSGSGKTTLLNLIGLLDRPTEGRILLDGHDTGYLDDDARTRLRAEALGFVFQFHHLLTAFTAAENVMIPLMSVHGRREGWMRSRALELLEEVGLADRSDYRVIDLSGGQQQRVAVARSLVMDPPLILADEPTGNLDTEAGTQVLRLMRSFNERRGAAFLIVTHDEHIAARCDRVVHMVDGRVDSDTRNGGARDADLPTA